MRFKKFIMSSHVLAEALFRSFRTIVRGWKRPHRETDFHKKLLLMGNGPSLKNVDLQRFLSPEIDIACVNFFPLKERKSFVFLKPKYLFLIDGEFFEEKSSKINQIDDLFTVLEEVDWKLTIVTPRGCTKKVSNPKLCFEHVYGEALYAEPFKRLRYFLYSQDLLCCGRQNVIISAANFFVNKRVGTIYLAGVDMSEFKGIFIDRNNNIVVKIIHSYGAEELQISVHQECGRIKRGEFYKLLGMYTRMFEQFHCLAEYAESQGVQVINLSLESYLDNFIKDENYNYRKNPMLYN